MIEQYEWMMKTIKKVYSSNKSFQSNIGLDFFDQEESCITKLQITLKQLN